MEAQLHAQMEAYMQAQMHGQMQGHVLSNANVNVSQIQSIKQYQKINSPYTAFSRAKQNKTHFAVSSGPRSGTRSVGGPAAFGFGKVSGKPVSPRNVVGSAVAPGNLVGASASASARTLKIQSEQPAPCKIPFAKKSTLSKSDLGMIWKDFVF